MYNVDVRQRAFLSTPSARRATQHARRQRRTAYISIHALREEGDLAIVPRGLDHADFYPRPPRGGRPLKYAVKGAMAKFLSTPSARRATQTEGKRR